jgi:hypothetical protein
MDDSANFFRKNFEPGIVAANRQASILPRVPQKLRSLQLARMTRLAGRELLKFNTDLTRKDAASSTTLAAAAEGSGRSRSTRREGV